jgi:NAD(P)-dependent dehydrogenase (short-subunit alcohol dehydrogenase family)
MTEIAAMPRRAKPPTTRRTAATSSRGKPRAYLVTGAAKGIGRGIALRLLADGHRVGVVDLEKPALTRAFARHRERVEVIPGDVADDTLAEHAVQQLLERFGRLDGIVSNAGIFLHRPLRELSPADFRRILDINLTATFLLARAGEAPLRRARGSIVTIASTRALMSEPGTEAYSASKGGLVALTHALAVSLGPDVRVNCVSPGWIVTEGQPTPSDRDHAQHPAGRVGTPEDVAELVAYLLDGTRSGFVTGVHWVIDGGMTRKMIYVE